LILAGAISTLVLPSTAAPLSYPQTLSPGWNLVGNSLTTPVDVQATFGGTSTVQTVWKWDSTASKWAFYAPSLDATKLQEYTNAKGYALLSSINAGEGYWVNVAGTTPIDRGVQSGQAATLNASALKTGWNLVASGTDMSPANFSASIGNVTTLWAWNNASNVWYFFAPSLAEKNTLSSYIQSKQYQEFGALTLGKGLGFWVNYAGAPNGGTGATGATSPNALACAGMACGAGTTPGGITPILPASTPSISRLSGANPAAGLATSWAMAKADMSAKVFGSPTAAATARVNIQYYPTTTPPITPVYTTIEYDATGQRNGREGRYQFGADGKPLTTDDVLIQHTLNYYSSVNNKTKFSAVLFTGVGADGLWRTADDTASSSDYLYGLMGSDTNAHHIIIPILEAGIDKVFFTDDDSLSQGWEFVSANPAGHTVQAVHFNNTGTDGKAFTTDDVIGYYTAFSVDANGNNLLAVTYNGAGLDKQWFTSDDVVQSVVAGVVSGTQLTHLATFGAGTDKLWFTTDDVVTAWTYFAYDPNGKIRLTASHSGKGADNVWFTADDVALASSSLYDAAGNVRQAANHMGTGPDGKWFTGDDVVADYTLYGWDAASKLQTLSAAMTNKGADGQWFTADDVPGNSYWVKSFDANGRVMQDTSFGVFTNGIFDGLGQDGKAFTADDVKNYSINHYVNGVSTGQVNLADKGADGLAFTADDVITGGYNEITKNDAGLPLKYVNHKSAGADGLWFTADDPISSLATTTYDAQNRVTSYIHFDAPGPDGLWETSDDMFSYKVTTTYNGSGVGTTVTVDSTGAITQWTRAVPHENGRGRMVSSYYGGAGTDGQWQTADDVVSYVSYEEVDALGQQLASSYASAGADGLLGTADDEFSDWTRWSVDGAGKIDSTVKFVAKGADGKWFTLDDIPEWATYEKWPWVK